jgi:uncharacterized membrane protein YciS (DUF1049 family)
MNIPDTLKTPHDSGWKKLYADLIKIYSNGYSMVLGRFYGLINLVLLGSTYLITKGFELTFIESITIGAGFFIFIMVSGLVYLKLGLQKSEYSSNLKEQPEMLEILNTIREMNKKLDLIEERVLHEKGNTERV